MRRLLMLMVLAGAIFTTIGCDDKPSTSPTKVGEPTAGGPPAPPPIPPKP